MKSFKIHIVKFIAIVISILYIFMPIHKEVKSMLHTMSHYLQMPNTVLSHNLDDNLDYKYSKSTISNHEHVLIDILDFFSDDNSQNTDSNKPGLVDISIDKHFRAPKFKVIRFVRTESLHVIGYREKNIKKGFYRKIKIPPKAIIT